MAEPSTSQSPVFYTVTLTAFSGQHPYIVQAFELLADLSQSTINAEQVATEVTEMLENLAILQRACPVFIGFLLNLFELLLVLATLGLIVGLIAGAVTTGPALIPLTLMIASWFPHALEVFIAVCSTLLLASISLSVRYQDQPAYALDMFLKRYQPLRAHLPANQLSVEANLPAMRPPAGSNSPPRQGNNSPHFFYHSSSDSQLENKATCSLQP